MDVYMYACIQMGPARISTAERTALKRQRVCRSSVTFFSSSPLFPEQNEHLYCILPNTRGCDTSAILMKISSAGWRYSGARRRFWSRWCPMNPMLRPSTNRPFNVPILIYSSASSGVNAPLSRRRSTKQTAIQPSTLRMSYRRRSGQRRERG